MTLDQPPDPDQTNPVSKLNAAWYRYPPAPAFGAFVSLETDVMMFADLVRADAQQRLRHGEAVRLERYRDSAQAAAPYAREALDPGRELTRVVIGFERLAGNSIQSVLDRLGDAYASDVEHAFEDDGASPHATLPPTEASAHQRASPAAPPNSTWIKGDQIGAFTLRKRLGEGGFGEVWLASREKPHQEVAVKVLRPDAADEASIRRFEAEAQALAFLEHRYIAKIVDAGTVRGMPYLVMEYVEGKTLTRYCDDHRLSIPQRLELMARVCEGVQHAHLRGLIHRDLKPDNILVTEVTKHPKDLDEHEGQLVVRRTDGRVTVAVPKIVDFGLAKAAEKAIRLADGTLTVDLGKMMGTPEYMSPEQAGHQPLEVTQQADIFSLGVILYELLTGTLPLTKEELRARMIDEMVAVLRGTPRPDPSTKLSSLDADTIKRVSYQRGDISPKEFEQRIRGRVRHLCGKALRLEPERRFTSSAAMAQDVRNYLADRDFVEAAAEPRTQKVLRNIRRHRGRYSAAAVVLIAITLAGSLGYRESLARRDARQQQAAASAVLRLFTDDVIAAASPGKAGRMMSLEEVLDGAAGRLDEPNREPLHAATERLLRSAIGQTYVALGKYAEAQSHLDAALGLPAPRDANPRDEVLLLLSAADVKYRVEDLDRFETLLDAAKYEAYLISNDEELRGQVIALIATLLRAQGKWDEATEQYERAIASFKQLGAEGRIDVLRQSYNIALVDSEWAKSVDLSADEQVALRERAISRFREVLAGYELLRDPLDDSEKLSFANVQRELARDLLRTGAREDTEEAERLLRASITVTNDLRGPRARQTLMARFLRGRALGRLPGRTQDAADELLITVRDFEGPPLAGTEQELIAIMHEALETLAAAKGRESAEVEDWLQQRARRLQSGPAYDWVIDQLTAFDERR